MNTLEGELDNRYQLLIEDATVERVSRPGDDSNERTDADTTRQQSGIRNRIRRLRGQTQTVSANELDELEKRDRVDLGDFDVFVTVYCTDCDTQFSVDLENCTRDC